MLRKSNRGPIAWKSKIHPRKATGNLRCVTLDLGSDPHARAAIEAYADSCEVDLPWLAEVLRGKLTGVDEPATYCDGTVRRLLDSARSHAQAQPDYSDAAWEHVVTNLGHLLKIMRKISNDEIRKMPGEETGETRTRGFVQQA